MIVAGFDIASTTGAAIFDGDVLVRCSAFRPEGDTDAEIFHGFRSWFRGLVRHYGVEYVAIEQPLISSGGPTAAGAVFSGSACGLVATASSGTAAAS